MDNLHNLSVVKNFGRAGKYQHTFFEIFNSIMKFDYIPSMFDFFLNNLTSQKYRKQERIWINLSLLVLRKFLNIM